MESSERSNIQRERKGAKEERFDIRYELLKNALDKENIQYDPEIKNYEELRDYVRANLSAREQTRLDKILSDAQEEMLNFAGRVKEETQGKIHNAWDVIKKNFFKVTSPVALATLLDKTAREMVDVFDMLFGGYTPSKEAFATSLGAATTWGAGATLVGSAMLIAYKRNVQAEIYNGVIRILETTKDKDGKIVDTRFNDEEREEIQKYFESIGKKLDISDYNNIREEIRKLPNSKKLELINRINDFKGNPINVKEEIAKNQFSLGKNIKDTFSAAKKGYLKGNQTVKQVVDVIEKIPMVGKLAGLAINLGSGAIGIPISIADMLIKKIEGSIKRKEEIKEEKRKIENADKRLYSKKDKELSENQRFMLEIIKRYMQEKGVKFDEDIQDKSDLKCAIEGMSKEDKKELNRMLAIMQKQLRRAEFKKNSKKVLNDTKYEVRITPMSNIIGRAFESPERDFAY